MSQVIQWQEAQGVSIMALIGHFASPTPAVFPATFISHLVHRCQLGYIQSWSSGAPQPIAYLTSFQLLLFLSLFSPRLSVPLPMASRFCAIRHWRVIFLPGPHPLQEGQVGHEHGIVVSREQVGGTQISAAEKLISAP